MEQGKQTLRTKLVRRVFYVAERDSEDNRRGHPDARRACDDPSSVRYRRVLTGRGQVVVLDVDEKKKRIGLSIKQAREK